MLNVALLVAGAIFIGWLCVRAATAEALARRNPIAAATIAPRDPRVAIGLANLEFRARQGAVSPTASRQALLALQSAPLSADPFFFASLARLIAGQHEPARALIAEARQRNPRSRMIRLISLDQALRTGRVGDAAVEIAVISRLLPETSKILIPELARYAADAQTAPALIDALKPDANLRNAVLEHLASKGGDPQAILRLAASGPAPAQIKGPPEWQRRLLDGMVAKGDISGARNLWSQFSGADGRRPEGIYDGAFRGAPGPAPFNWQLTESSAGIAERTKAPALQVEYYGRADAELASQLLQLSAGRHFLSFAAAGNTPASGGSLAWTLTCHPKKQPVASVPLRALNNTAKRLSGAFVVPADCPAQWLRLVGTPAEFPRPHSATISDLQVRKSAAS